MLSEGACVFDRQSTTHWAVSWCGLFQWCEPKNRRRYAKSPETQKLLLRVQIGEAYYYVRQRGTKAITLCLMIDTQIAKRSYKFMNIRRVVIHWEVLQIRITLNSLLQETHPGNTIYRTSKICHDFNDNFCCTTIFGVFKGSRREHHQISR